MIIYEVSSGLEHSYTLARVFFALKGLIMAGSCAICGKGCQFGQNIRHKHSGSWARRAPRTKKTWLPNLQPVKTIIGGTPTRLRVCTKCMKAGKVNRAV